LPELPEVEAVCHRLRKQALGAQITAFHAQRPSVTSPQTPDEIARASAGARIQAVRRRGKNILIDFTGGSSLRIHLRMTGDLYVIPDVRFRPVTARAWFELSDGRALVFDDSRALGKIHAYPTSEIESVLGHLGVEPLSKAFRPETLVEAARNSHRPVKLLLMDQTVVVGLGNIYAAEALFRAGIDPRRPADRIRAARLCRLHAEIVEVLRTAVQSTRIAYMSPGRFTEAESFPLAVYDREDGNCGMCGRTIRRIQQGGRSTYFCPGCQR
jgi:formamidopyrimidine-DNA glycosylase